ncbi:MULTISPECIES: hypothetical protein [unclassified Caballeronia]|uniref:hypothetical protein n=1 Tax=unclassified Caballeronia TaxID=2646786 RepID=UPI002860B5C2|nr:MULTISPECIES: hypothetical protein [unclassified Caballeronia]MDR5772144.1 hypothetical protein [Caballeronia sp. LZ002]MDR5804423.1 hypothetical protein [Caballeronia sp. LZ001]MDR5847578.1 hypothetical protein [Caballeronia sp. LZ003]
MNRNFRVASGATRDVPPYAIKTDGTVVNLYADPNAYLATIGLRASGPVTVEQARLAVHEMISAMSRANSPSAQYNTASSFSVTDGNAPPASRTVRITMTHIDPSIRYANATGDLSPLGGFTDIVTDGARVGIDATGQGNSDAFNAGAVHLGYGQDHIHDAGRGYGVTGMSRGFGGLAAAKAELQQRDAAAQAWGRERAAENATTGNVIER